MSGFFSILLAPLNAVFALIGRFPWPAVALCVAGAAVLMLMRMQASAATLVMVGSIILIWLDETRSPRERNEVAAAAE